MALTKREIHARLIEKGTTFRRWSLEHGYKPRTVLMTVERWAERDDQPRGRLTYQILSDLSRFTGIEIVQGALTTPCALRRAA